MTSGFCTAWLSNLSLADVSVSYLLACVWSSNKLQLSEGIGCCRGQPPWPLCTLGPRQGTHQDTFPMASPVLGTIQWWHKSPLTPGTALSPFSSKVTHSLPFGDEKSPQLFLVTALPFLSFSQLPLNPSCCWQRLFPTFIFFWHCWIICVYICCSPIKQSKFCKHSALPESI